jgi:C4-dicarboxylate transporter, DctM subunit
MDATTLGIIGIVILVALFFTEMPISFVMYLIGFLGFSLMVSLDAGLSILAKDTFHVFSSGSLTALPMFVLMGHLAFNSGIGRRLYDSAYKIMGHLPGGLAIATIGACACFAAICGSTIATASTMCSVAYPEMKRYGYDDRLSTGTIAAGGTLGILIPPSSIFIVYGIMTEQSIGKLFAAGILPGILLAVLFMATIFIHVKKNPRLAPPPPDTRFSWREKSAGVVQALDMLAIFVMVVGGLFAGFFTPTEAGAIGALGTFLVALVRKEMTWKVFSDSLAHTARVNCMVFVIIAGAIVFGHFMAVTRIPFDLADWVGGLPLPRWTILALIIVVYIIGGCFMDGLAFVLLTVPIFYPVILRLGYDPIWFGVIIVLLTEMAAITPPVGINAFTVGGMLKEIPLDVVFRGVFIFTVPLTLCMILLILFPQIALLLPGFMD